MIHVTRCEQRIIIVIKIVVKTPHTWTIKFYVLRKTPVSDWSQILLNEIIKLKLLSSLSHTSSPIAVLISAGVGINHVIYSHATKVFLQFPSSFALVNITCICQECESFLNCEPHNTTYMCVGREKITY